MNIYKLVGKALFSFLTHLFAAFRLAAFASYIFDYIWLKKEVVSRTKKNCHDLLSTNYNPMNIYKLVGKAFFSFLTHLFRCFPACCFCKLYYNWMWLEKEVVSRTKKTVTTYYQQIIIPWTYTNCQILMSNIYDFFLSSTLISQTQCKDTGIPGLNQRQNHTIVKFLFL